MDRIESKLDKLDERMDKLDNTLAEISISLVKLQAIDERNTSSLEEHIRRTELLEQHQDEQMTILEEKLKPVSDLIVTAKVIVKVCGGLSVILGLMFAIYKLGE
jgi:chromosome segregation ATPase